MQERHDGQQLERVVLRDVSETDLRDVSGQVPEIGEGPRDQQGNTSVPQVKEILISKTMRLGAAGYAEAAGVWEPAEGRIVIKRDQLSSIARYAGTLLHEIAHAETGTPDISAGFEDALTGELGEVAGSSLGDSRG
jgi:hypothetical protein